MSADYVVASCGWGAHTHLWRCLAASPLPACAAALAPPPFPPPPCRSLFAPTWLFVAATAWPFNSDICSTAPLSNPAARAATAAIYKPLR